MNLDSVKDTIQKHFQSGLVVIVGSGLSVAESIPGMGALESFLRSEIPKSIAKLTKQEQNEWEIISKLLHNNKGLESALKEVAPSPKLENLIIKLTYKLISDAETKTIAEVVEGSRVLAFSRLLPLLSPEPHRPLPVVTTNYDRLIEIAAEKIGWGVDTLFVGTHFGLLKPEVSRASFISRIAKKKRIEYRKRIQLLKPHGSLDWYQQKAQPIRSSIPLNQVPLIVTPGGTKYHRGYSPPFDTHREKAIDKGSRYLIIGYGFNDDHLETHLRRELSSGKPALLITHSLTPNAEIVLKESPGLIAITANPKDDKNGFLHATSKGCKLFAGPLLWDIKHFVQEVFS